MPARVFVRQLIWRMELMIHMGSAAEENSPVELSLEIREQLPEVVKSMFGASDKRSTCGTGPRKRPATLAQT